MKASIFFISIIVLLFSGIRLLSNDNSISNYKIIPKAPDLDSLWKIAVEEFDTDSSTVLIRCEFWYNAMPGADNSQTCWYLEPNDKLIYGGAPPYLTNYKAYFFSSLDDKNQTITSFEYDEKGGWKKDHKFYFRPAGVILVLYDKRKKQYVYLKKSGPFIMGRVE